MQLFRRFKATRHSKHSRILYNSPALMYFTLEFLTN